MIDEARGELDVLGTLRVATNLSNILLVNDRQADGTPVGVSPDMSKALADRLGAEVSYQCYNQVGETADAISSGAADIGLIAYEEQRAQTIAFSPAYCVIEATYLVRDNSPVQTIEDVDQPGTKIAVANRAAYDLYLTRTLKHAELVRTTGLPETAAMFVRDRLDVLAGLRPALLDNAKEIEGSRVIDGCYTTVQQAIGTQPQKTALAGVIADFVAETKANGTVAGFIDRHGMTGRLIVAEG